MVVSNSPPKVMQNVLNGYPPGILGKLKIYASGAVKLQLGDVLSEVSIRREVSGSTTRFVLA